MVVLTIVGIYFLVLILLGVLAMKGAKKTAEDYFVANRSIGSFVLTVSVFATLYSAFTVVAQPGLVYANGPGLWAGLTIGNLLFTPLIVLLGYKIWTTGRKYGLVTPAELFEDRFQSRPVAIVLVLIMIALVLPYIAIQPISGGYLVSTLSGGTISYLWGAILTTAVMVIYVFLSGQRAVAWNDTLQGVLMAVVLWGTLFVCAYSLGGFGEATRKVAEAHPQMLTIPGPKNYWVWKMSLSWALFVGLNVMLQPQIFVRYYTGRSADTIKWSFTTWPLLVLLGHLPPTLIGVYGILIAPALKAPDQLVPHIWATMTPPWFQGLATAGLLAALMSTASGQLLVLSSMIVRDLWLPYRKARGQKDLGPKEQYWLGRILVVALAVISFLIGLRPPQLMGLLAGAAFSGIAILAPAAIAAFYWRRATAAGVISSALAGELIVLGTYFKLIPAGVWGGFDASIPGLAVAVVLLVVVSLLTARPSEGAIARYVGVRIFPSRG